MNLVPFPTRRVFVSILTQTPYTNIFYLFTFQVIFAHTERMFSENTLSNTNRRNEISPSSQHTFQIGKRTNFLKTCSFIIQQLIYPVRLLIVAYLIPICTYMYILLRANISLKLISQNNRVTHVLDIISRSFSASAYARM